MGRKHGMEGQAREGRHGMREERVGSSHAAPHLRPLLTFSPSPAPTTHLLPLTCAHYSPSPPHLRPLLTFSPSPAPTTHLLPLTCAHYSPSPPLTCAHYSPSPPHLRPLLTFSPSPAPTTHFLPLTCAHYSPSPPHLRPLLTFSPPHLRPLLTFSPPHLRPLLTFSPPSPAPTTHLLPLTCAHYSPSPPLTCAHYSPSPPLTCAHYSPSPPLTCAHYSPSPPHLRPLLTFSPSPAPTPRWCSPRLPLTCASGPHLRQCPSPAPVPLTCASGPHLRQCPSPAPVPLTCASAPHLRQCPSPAPVPLTCASAPHLRQGPSPAPVADGSAEAVHQHHGGRVLSPPPPLLAALPRALAAGAGRNVAVVDAGAAPRPPPLVGEDERETRGGTIAAGHARAASGGVRRVILTGGGGCSIGGGLRVAANQSGRAGGGEGALLRLAWRTVACRVGGSFAMRRAYDKLRLATKKWSRPQGPRGAQRCSAGGRMEGAKRRCERERGHAEVDWAVVAVLGPSRASIAICLPPNLSHPTARAPRRATTPIFSARRPPHALHRVPPIPVRSRSTSHGLSQMKYYHHCLFHRVQRDFIVQTGDPTATGAGGDSVYKFLYGEQARFFEDEIRAGLKHDKVGVVAMASGDTNLNASQFYITTRAGLDSLDGKHTIFGEVAEGLDTLQRINEAFVDDKGRPFKNIRIRRVHVLDDPFDDPPGLADLIPDASPPMPPPAAGSDVRLEDDWVPMDEGRAADEVERDVRRREAQSRGVVLEMIGDLPEAEFKPPENVLFICKLNPVTQDDDLEIIFSRFGKVLSADIIRDQKTGDSLCYGFIEFETKEACEAAYFKMDGVLIDDRRVHVDFSQSVGRLWSRFRRFGTSDSAHAADAAGAATGGGRGGRGGGRGRGGGGGRGGMRSCFSCGEDGRMARECPNAGGGRGGMGGDGEEDEEEAEGGQGGQRRLELKESGHGQRGEQGKR
ncbi:unnamed protein product [Closterium sp. Naga37s-1]|nr:unnamed protein product [Closterium sp. Naga37s-1]